MPTPPALELAPHARRAFEAWGLTVDARATARLAPSRNFTVVARAARERLLVKFSASPLEPSLAHEAAVLRWLDRHRPDPSAVAVPVVHRGRAGLLALEWATGAPCFSGPRGVELTTSRRVGQALAALHELRPPRFSAAPSAIDQLLEARAHLTPVEHAVRAQLLKRPLVVQTWRHLVGHTPRPALVHGDFRAANILVHRAQVTVVDWEVSGRGDGWRDVGSFLAELIAAWAAPRSRAEALPLETVRKRSAAFLTGYLGDRAAVADAVARAAAWTADALLAHALAAHLSAPRLGPAGRRLLAHALALVEAPQRSAGHLWRWNATPVR